MVTNKDRKLFPRLVISVVNKEASFFFFFEKYPEASWNMEKKIPYQVIKQITNNYDKDRPGPDGAPIHRL